jgi:cytoskeletal protein CcmA (bactofilin family)
MSPEEKKLTQETATPKTSSRLGQHLTLDGNISGHEDLEIQGNLTGKIDLTLHDLVIQKTAKVKAEIKAKNLFLHGELDGQIRAERVVISETGRFSGDLVACKIAVQNGAKFKGTIKISKDYQP